MSTVQPFRAALAALWDAAPTVDAVVSLSPRWPTRRTARLIIIGQATGDTDRPTMGETRKVREVYDVPVIVSVTSMTTPDHTQTVAEEAQALADAAELVLRSTANESLAGVEWAAVLGQFVWEEATAEEVDGGVNITLTFSVRVRATYRLS